MKSAQFWPEKEPIKLGSTATQLFLATAEMVQLLGVSDNELTRLARNGVVVRRRDPADAHAYLYSLWPSLRGYLGHLRSRREKASLAFLEEKRRAQRAVRKRAELETAIKRARLIDKEEALEWLRPAMLRIREAMEQALSVGVPRLEVDRIVGFLQRADDVIEEGPNGKNGNESE